MRSKQVKRDPAVFRKYLDGSLMRRLTLQLPILLLFLMTEPGHSHLGHCLETHTGSHLEVGERDSPDNTVISHLTTANSYTAFHDIAPGPLQKI